MFFSGDSTTRKRVDLGGRSSKERDARKLLEQTRLERNRRLMIRQQNSAAIKIQKFFRGRKSMEIERSKMRQQFCESYGKYCQNVDRHCFGPDSGFLRLLLFFFNARNVDDFKILVETCRLFQDYVSGGGDVISLLAGMNCSSELGLVEFRVKKLAFSCIEAVHRNREFLKDQLLVGPQDPSIPITRLLETVVILLDPNLPWACKTADYLLERNALTLFRECVSSANKIPMVGHLPSLERVLMRIVMHICEKPCVSPMADPRWSFSSQILTIPFVWKFFPNLKVAFGTPTLSQHYIHQMALCVQNHTNILPPDLSSELPSYACLFGNILETAVVALSQPDCSFEMAIDLSALTAFFLEALPPLKSSERESQESSTLEEDDMIVDEVPSLLLDRALEEQITNAIDSNFLLQLTNVLFRGVSFGTGSCNADKEVVAIGAACSFLYAAFNALPLERIMTILAYRTEVVPVLWKYMKQCHESEQWSSMPRNLACLPEEAPGWLLPLVVFCPVYKHMLMIVDNEEFYERQKPLSLEDIRLLIIILKQALWQLLWVNPSAQPSTGKPVYKISSKKNPVDFIQHRLSVVASELLSQLQDWNNRREFTSQSDFQADVVNDYFISQAVIEDTRANYILKQAPFLIPFTSRVKIFTSQLAAARQRHGSQVGFARNRFRIRRDHILEDAYNQMSALSEDDLRESIRVTFVNELGVEEAGIDGGGIFKDFLENIARAAFDVQYGLFKETDDHMVYPNPGSGMIHEQHLQFFNFLGSLLAKAMFEGILIDIPFATFFLSKLKQKHNYLNDLPSLDPELYRHLIFLKHYKGDVSELELFFVILNNEYGEQTEEELLPGGKNLRVTKDNVIQFIHLVANHRLNFQIRQQSSHFLRGFQQLIQKEWLDMFNEHELQVLISGSVDSLDIDDLRNNTNYAGGYNSGHYVIEMFWEVLKSLPTENQKKFLKFVTGCSRGPLLGFKYLEPAFCIQRAGGSVSDELVDRLPTSATCMNLLKLPPYRSKEQLETKLLYAINAEAGFDLS